MGYTRFTDDEVRAHLATLGFTGVELEDEVAYYRSAHAALNSRRCACCFRDLTRTLAPSQTGEPSLPGRWWRYECLVPSCRWFYDRKETDD